MPRLRRGDGIELHWEERGEGELVVIAPHWAGIPEVFDPLVAELAIDHRVVRFDARGTGRSSRMGPHDMETGADDLEAIAGLAGGDAVVVGMLDACNRAMRVAARRPALVPAVVGIAALPAPRSALAGTESMIASDAVMETLVEQFAIDYRAAVRTIAADGNSQMSEEEVRDRVQRQVDYCPREAGIPRIREFVLDDVEDAALSLGARLHLVYSPEIAGAWFPPLGQLRELLARVVPDASIDVIDGGIVTNPEAAAGIVRRARAAASAGVG